MTTGLTDVLDSLNPRYGFAIRDTDKTQIDAIYASYLRDFFDIPFRINGKDVKAKDFLYTKHVSDGLPVYFGQYHEKFVHLLTREVPGKTVMQPKTRIFKENRANRIHWIKPVLLHWQDPRITYFHFLESDGIIREYFWYKAKDYIVVLESVAPDYFLITAFCIDYKNRSYFEGKLAGRCGP